MFREIDGFVSRLIAVDHEPVGFHFPPESRTPHPQDFGGLRAQSTRLLESDLDRGPLICVGPIVLVALQRERSLTTSGSDFR